MSLDNIAVRALALELNAELGTAIVKTVRQVSQDDLLIATSMARLLISLDRSFPCLLLTGSSLKGVSLEIPFVGAVRSRLERTTLLRVDQIDLDRLLRLSFGAGESSDYHLLCELIPRSPNVILTDRDDRVLDAWKGSAISKPGHGRLVLGELYAPPTPPMRERLGLAAEAMAAGRAPGLDSIPETEREARPSHQVTLPECADPEESQRTIERILSITPDEASAGEPADIQETFVRGLVGLVRGLSPLLAREVLHDTGIAAEDAVRDPEVSHRLAHNLSRVARDVRDRHFTPLVYVQRGEPIAISALPLSLLEDVEADRPTSMSEAIETFARLRARAESRRSEISQLAKMIRRSIKRYERLEEKQLSDLEATDDALTLQMKGELIIANLDRIDRGMEQVDLTGYHEGGERKISVELEPDLSPRQNAISYFRRARKARRGRRQIETRIRSTLEKLGALRALGTRIETIRAWQMGEPVPSETGLRTCMSLTPERAEEDLREIRRALADQGIGLARARQPPSARPGRPASDRLPRAVPRRFATRRGLTILVGRDNQENDLLTFKVARPRDIFLHARGVPGSHTILITDDGRIQPDKSDILDAASIAAHFSKARSSGIVPVAYTERRHVRKPRGAQPGVVILSQEKVIFVEPRSPQPQD